MQSPLDLGLPYLGVVLILWNRKSDGALLYSSAADSDSGSVKHCLHQFSGNLKDFIKMCFRDHSDIED